MTGNLHKRITAIFLTAVMVFCSLPAMTLTAAAAGGATEVYVDSAYTEESCGGHVWGFNAFKSVREGIDAVATGGTVDVAAGSYIETGEIEVTRPMTVRGGNRWEGGAYIENTCVSVTPPVGSTHCDTIFWVHDCQDVFISGLTLDRSVESGGEETPTSESGVVFTGGCDFNGSRVSECKVVGKRVVPDDNCFSALEVIQADDVIFEYNIVEGVVNSDEFAAEEFYDGGIGELGGCEDIVIRGNYIDGLGSEGSPRGGDGISCVMAGEVTIENNVVTGCRYGIYENQVSLTITGNEICDNDIGVQCGAWTMALHQNAVYDNIYNISCGYTEAEKVDAANNYWGLFDEASIKASCDGNVSVSPWATDDERDADGDFKYLSVFTYTYAGGEAAVASYTGSDSKACIPGTTISGGTAYPVTAIGDSVFLNKTSLREIGIPETVTSIGDSAFKGSGLTAVAIPDSVTSIGAHAFEDCTSLAAANIPENVTVLSESVFNNTAIAGIRIPDGVTTIGQAAFAFCRNLESVTIPGSVSTIEDGAFIYGAFSDCENLKSVVIEAGDLSKIGNWAFTYCLSLESISIPENVTVIGSYAFNHTALKAVDLPDGLTTIGQQAFSDNDAIVSVEIPESLTSIGIWAFTDFDSVNASMTDVYFYGDAPAADPYGWYPEYPLLLCGSSATVHYISGKTEFGCDEDGDRDGDPAKWYGSPTAIFVPVTFDLNGAAGSAPEKQLLGVGGKVGKPADPGREGYIFGGWYENPECTGEAWAFDTAQVTDTTGTLTLYAAWTRVETSDGSSDDDTPAGSGGASVEVNGETRNAGTAETREENGITVTTVTVDSDTLAKILEDEGENATIRIPITTGSDTAAGVLTGQDVKGMEEKEATLVVETGSAVYTVPASEIDIGAVSGQFGQDVSLSDITVSVSISAPSAEMVRAAENAARAEGFSVVIPAVEFGITCTYGGETVEVSRFTDYIERMVAIPEGVDPEKITTGVVVRADGTTYHVPTQIVVVDGVYYAVMSSLTNSAYAVIWNPVEFSDVEDHWAKDAVNDMGSRMVVSGVGGENYAPDRGMTRAEFAAVAVRALGLAGGAGESGFADVAPTDWFYGYVGAAAAYGLIKGYDGLTYGPDDGVTREQAMTIIARAIKLTGLDVTLTDGEAGALLSAYADGADVSDCAREGAAVCIKAGIVTGTSAGTILAKDYVTRAEAAVMIRRLLQKSGLI